MDLDSSNSRLPARGFLPDFCQVRVTLGVVIAAELLTIVLCVARFTSLQNFWSDLSILSLYVQWIALTVSSLLCLAKRWLVQHTVLQVSLLTIIVLLSVTAAIASVAYYRVLVMESNTGFAAFLLQSLTISFLLGLMSLHYFYLQFLLSNQQQAESDAKFQALQAKIRPHFLFNSMNTIASLTRSDPEMAENIVVDLAELFRASISDSGKPSTIGKELELARGYMNIEQTRLGDRLQVILKVDEALKDVEMPAMMIQPLLENAVYHGVEHSENGGNVTLLIAQQEDQVLVQISNSVPAGRHKNLFSRASGNQQAQENIRQRLQSFYGEKARFMTEQTETEYRVKMIFQS